MKKNNRPAHHVRLYHYSFWLILLFILVKMMYRPGPIGLKAATSLRHVVKSLKYNKRKYLMCILSRGTKYTECNDSKCSHVCSVKPLDEYINR